MDDHEEVLKQICFYREGKIDARPPGKVLLDTSVINKGPVVP